MPPRTRVFTISSSAPFLPTLIAAVRSGVLAREVVDDPLALSRMTLFLPTRRAGRLAREAFLEAPGTDATLLPRIVALGDIDEDALLFADSATGGAAAQALELPPSIDAFERRILLAKLVQHWARAPAIQDAHLVAASPAAAFALAEDLAHLLDDLTTREVPWSAFDTLVPDDFDFYWQRTLDFLKIARSTWPEVLAGYGVMEPAARRDRLIDAEAARLAGSDGPVIAAGSTGSIPATAKLLATIAALPHGAVVLPGLDTELDEDSWEAIGRDGEEGGARALPAVGHPQFAMHALLRRMGIRRTEVRALTPVHARDLLVSEVLRPAATTDRWPARLAEPGLQDRLAEAMAGITVIEAATVEEEALAIALALRETIEDPDRTAALITPDRPLARRVTAALARWDVPVDDTAGDPLAETPAGVFARLAAETALGGLAPVPLLALLKHPLCRLAEDAGACVGALEFAILRGPRPQPGSVGLMHALDTFRRGRVALHRTDPRRNLDAGDLDAAAALLGRVQEALRPLEELDASDRPLADLARRHASVVDRLRRCAEDTDRTADTEDGQSLAHVFDDLGAARDADLSLAPADYPELFIQALGGRIVRRAPNGARVRIFGLLEARLQNVDRLVLGELVEGVWPPQPRPDPWLSRPMRHRLGLDLPERRIGLSAHDFAQALGTRDVILTRSRKRDGAPTVPSRFMQRLAAVAGRDLWLEACARSVLYLDLARLIDRPSQIVPVSQTAFSPPLTARPARLSVSDIEDLLRDPYTIYARRILGLVPIDPIDTPPGAADRGSVIHSAIEEFTRRTAAHWPADPVGELIAIGADAFAPLSDYPEARAFWWPRFLRIAHWFVDFESERRGSLAAVLTEEHGAIGIDVGTRTVRLSARADRIEQRRDGTVAILDYKTGRAPSAKQVRTGLSPQLTLEGAIALRGGFKGVAASAPLADLAYVELRGGIPPGAYKPVASGTGDANTESEKALARVTEVLRRFETEPYRSLVLPMWRSRYGDYDHLARVKEWSATGGETQAEEG